MLRLCIRRIAESKGYTVSTLSKASGLSYNTIRHIWLRSNYQIRSTTLCRIALILGVSIDELVEVIPDT